MKLFQILALLLTIFSIEARQGARKLKSTKVPVPKSSKTPKSSKVPKSSTMPKSSKIPKSPKMPDETPGNAVDESASSKLSSSAVMTLAAAGAWLLL